MRHSVKNKGKIRVLFFDIGGVCLTDGWEYASRQKAAEHFSLDLKEMDRRHRLLLEEYECGRISRSAYLAYVVFYKKRKFSEAAFIRFIEGESKPYKATLDILKKLKASEKYLLGVLSNESYELNNFRIKKFGLQGYFTHFFSSCFLGIRKPDPRFYKIALQVTQKVPREILYIDDREVNVKAARALHINCIHLEQAGDLAEKLRSYGIEW